MGSFWTVHVDGLRGQMYVNYKTRGEANMVAERFARENPGVEATVFQAFPVATVKFSALYEWRDVYPDAKEV